jgi:hypothetical protein
MDNHADKHNTDCDCDCGDCSSPTVANNGRRAFAKLGLAAPVLLTLSSRPIMAGGCLSNILSGNLSDPSRGDCQLGWSPGGWCNPVGQINGLLTLDAWDAATGIAGSYGTYNPDCGNDNKPKCYVAGATLGDVGLSLMGLSSDTPLREVVCSTGNGNQVARACATAWLNASLSENSGGTFKYVLSVEDVIGLCSGTIIPPGGMSVKDFLHWTWEAGAHGSSDYIFDNN